MVSPVGIRWRRTSIFISSGGVRQRVRKDCGWGAASASVVDESCDIIFVCLDGIAVVCIKISVLLVGGIVQWIVEVVFGVWLRSTASENILL
jgi:hypothetical protein